jgi:transcriptional antiterminator RfaH
LATHKPVHVDELFGELTLPEGAAKWSVVHTKPQCEKKLVDYLKRNGIWYYLALYDSERVYQHRKVLFTKPLFPGYVFSCFELKDRFTILNCGYVVRFIKVPNQQELLDDLNWIYQGRLKQAEFEQAEWLEQGWQVEIVSGPMQGMSGVVESQTKLNEVTLQVNILRQSVKVKVNPADVRILYEYYGH